MKFKYRKAKLDDAQQISVLFGQVYIHTYGTNGVSKEFTIAVESEFNIPRLEADITGDECLIWIATYDENPIAALKIYRNKKCPNQEFSAPEIHKLYMLSHFYGQGIAHKLLRKGESELRNLGEKKVWLWVLESNERAIRFYKKESYQAIGTADLQLSKNTYTNIIMNKQL